MKIVCLVCQVGIPVDNIIDDVIDNNIINFKKYTSYKLYDKNKFNYISEYELYDLCAIQECDYLNNDGNPVYIIKDQQFNNNCVIIHCNADTALQCKKIFKDDEVIIVVLQDTKENILNNMILFKQYSLYNIAMQLFHDIQYSSVDKLIRNNIKPLIINVNNNIKECVNKIKKICS